MAAGRDELTRLIRQFASAMKEHGFSRRSTHLWRDRTESREQICFSSRVEQVSCDTVAFVVEYAVFLRAFDDFYRSGCDTRHWTPLMGEYVGRLGSPLEDKRWVIESPEDVDRLVPVLVQRAQQEAFPFFKARGTLTSSLDLHIALLENNELQGRAAINTMIMAQLLGRPAVFAQAQEVAREKLSAANPAFWSKAQKFIAGLEARR